MVKAGLDTSLPWHTGRKWWQVGLSSLLDRIGNNIISQLKTIPLIVRSSGVDTQSIRRY
jgi:hypothetical protein